ncbi:Succinyl-diaminopimelate desuccinylase [Aquicella siphonis]|uniref:Succinyl-diaminopimelate desuccinylase n=1 Tax=Aquicella siphonis TaxID=254247 RepID=A0A5E4PI72_9COXI|nr:M20 family metallopeptidase [Aquicella siphonis]VVC76041.1 Succinyl-diaminopimelate desuccinylase [Aquicella siphonis]
MIEQKTAYIDQLWDNSITPTLMEYIRIPNKSPQFDKNWREHGYMDQAVTLISQWCHSNAVENMQLEVVRLENRTPVIFIEIPGSNDDTVLLYGHLDKQPEMSGWDTDLHPWKPVLRGDRLYGRGSADDGYSTFASLAAIKSLRERQIPHARCVILIEACEESGSSDLPYYINALEQRIGKPSLVICLDSGCGNYDQLWVTTSLRGLVGGVLKIDVLRQGVHSGTGSGIVPSCFRVLRQLLDRIENRENGDIILSDLHVDIPQQRLQQADQAARVLGKSVFEDLPFLPGVQPESSSIADLIIRRTWKPALSVIGMDGIPLIENAGNVTLPTLSVKLSMRLPPSCDAEKAILTLKNCLERNPPLGAKVHYEVTDNGSGWNAPAEQPWLIESAKRASLNFFGKEAVYMGEGGSIPFMGMLGEKFPQAQFLITGLLGPESNAHGPNEFLHIPTGKKLTACVAQVIADHYKRS